MYAEKVAVRYDPRQLSSVGFITPTALSKIGKHEVGTGQGIFIKGVQPKDRTKGGEGSGGSCTSMLVAIESVFKAIIYI